MKQHLIIYAHPNPQSFNHAILEQVVHATKKCGWQPVVRDLHALEFNPVLSWQELAESYQGIINEHIAQEHDFIRHADLITLIYPLWWMGFPAILKGYLDRTLTFGFAYQTLNGKSQGLLTGKRLQQFITIGSNWQEYTGFGFDKSIRDTLADGLFNFCGITDITHHVFDDIHLVDKPTLANYLESAYHITEKKLNAISSPNTFSKRL
ncbi:NAD(P)H-dependent oxidoreductase [Pasteurellaceae bacterium HPA106]|uniref:NAD(P)H-dependent oxidoreductase n=1 Tax=Spirabiliibacterium pneumoniae TaxID=221400 RepID=UPI001AAD9475|nr:NAD(P)H-dependent oxidoreductase [Spirabiliibacterium pneumoniae]MBE2895423.1 NAD(P)H-dependent oxidoreductase [Spirabiliibacterium pneumoniae]